MPKPSIHFSVEGQMAQHLLATVETSFDSPDHEPIVVDLGDPMDTAEHLIFLSLKADGLNEKQRERKLKRIRKAMGYSYP